MAPSILACENLAFSYDNLPVLDGVSLSIEEGDFLGVIGPNGSGKSTLIRLLAGLLTPKEGVVRLNGNDMAALSRRSISRELAALAQEESPDFGFTVWEEVMLGRAPHHGGLHFDSRSDRIIVEHAIEKTDLTHLRRRKMAEVSGGERQRVRIARGLAQQPRVLLLDEPTNHLDLYSQLSLMELMKDINSEGLAILLVSHDINFVSRACKRLEILHERTFRFSGPPQEVITEATIAAAFNIRAVVDRNPADGSPRMTPVTRLNAGPFDTNASSST